MGLPAISEQKKYVMADRVTGGLLFLCALIAVPVLFFNSPELPGNYPSCPWRQLTGGLLCPGCGSLRMLHCVLHGRFLDAFHYNPLGFFALPIIPCLIIHWGKLALNGSGFSIVYTLMSASFLRTLVVLLVTYTILRNIILYI